MIQSVEIETDLWFARRLPQNTGWTWTLASRLGHILRVAQDLYGPRDSSYTVLGVEFGGPTPQIWYPGNCGHVVIQITPRCATDMNRASFQMAHEAIHLLSPSGGKRTTVFEEGLANHFSIRYMREHLGATWSADVDSYQHASDQLEQLLEIEPDAVRLVRQRQPALYLLTPADIQAACPSAPSDLAVSLSRSFERGA